MFRIRRIYDDVLPINREIIQQAQGILLQQFSALTEGDVSDLGERLRNPFKQRFKTILFAGEDIRRQLLGFAILLHEPKLAFCYLDFLATGRKKMGGGIGGALYSRVREESDALGGKGLFFECLPDDPEACPGKELLTQNIDRLRFYEKYGARPITGTEYELPVKPGDTCMPHLVFDGLDRNPAPGRDYLKKVVRAILERKYGDYCPPAYVRRVVASIKDDPVALRPFRYVKPKAINGRVPPSPQEPVALVVNDGHDIHHVRDRGYVEAPVRIRTILEEIEPTGLFERIQPRVFADRHLTAVHDSDLIEYLKRASEQVKDRESLYPYVFPIRNKTRAPRDYSVLSGYYCIDTFTPIHRNAYLAARSGVNCALTAAREILEGRRLAYALVRPPGHHAERRAFGGFCYFNNAAIAAQYISTHGKVAILDVDYHHGNGQQDIFYARSDVLTVSVHGHPRFAYPYFSGFEDETGVGVGEGTNLNIPLPEKRNGDDYLKALIRALRYIDRFSPDFLLVALGLDTAKGDPTGTWSLVRKDFERNGRMIAEVGLPILVVQEGGYRTRTLGVNARTFLTALAESSRTARGIGKPRGLLQDVSFRLEPRPADCALVRAILQLTELFDPSEVDVAVELVQDRLNKKERSEYRFVFADRKDEMIGYACYGPIALTLTSFDLYWIAVHPNHQDAGLGRELLRRAENGVRHESGTRIYIDTSSRPAYATTRAFYEHNGYSPASILDDYYKPGDAKVVYCKVLG